MDCYNIIAFQISKATKSIETFDARFRCVMVFFGNVKFHSGKDKLIPGRKETGYKYRTHQNDYFSYCFWFHQFIFDVNVLLFR